MQGLPICHVDGLHQNAPRLSCFFSYFLVWYLCTCFRDDEGLETCLAALGESLNASGFSPSIFFSAESLSKLTSKLVIASIPAGIFDSYRKRHDVDTSSGCGKRVIVHCVNHSKLSGWTKQRYLFFLYDPKRDGEVHMRHPFQRNFKSAAHPSGLLS